jgi:hypothetical protein
MISNILLEIEFRAKQVWIVLQDCKKCTETASQKCMSPKLTLELRINSVHKIPSTQYGMHLSAANPSSFTKVKAKSTLCGSKSKRYAHGKHQHYSFQGQENVNNVQ